ncbi:MAG: hypothetical protein CMJ46_12880 [Planctomyces sp.]|nr:hypothetical protein [Planctomyces sp.]
MTAEIPHTDDLIPGPFLVPGGWSRDNIECGNRHYPLTRPAQPDLLLDDPRVLEENEEGVYIPYWALLWPAAARMAAMFEHGDWTPGATALELGCGVGLVGLAALQAGLRVTFTDYRQEAVELACWNAREAGFQADADFDGSQLDWNDPPTVRTFDHIFGCEIVYETDFHEPLLRALSILLAPGGRCWFGDSGRINSDKFFALATSCGWKITRLDRRLHPLTEPRIGRFQVFCLERDVTPVS